MYKQFYVDTHTHILLHHEYHTKVLSSDASYRYSFLLPPLLFGLLFEPSPRASYLSSRVINYESLLSSY